LECSRPFFRGGPPHHAAALVRATMLRGHGGELDFDDELGESASQVGGSAKRDSQEDAQGKKPEDPNPAPSKMRRVGNGHAAKVKECQVGAKAKGGQVRCPACWKHFAPTDLAMNSKFCTPDNGIKNILYGAARRSGDLKWFTEQLSTETATKKLFATHRKQFGVEGKVKIGTFLAKYIEEVSASTKVIYEEDGSMMTEDKYIDYAATPDGGRLAPKAAAAKWQTLCDAPDAFINMKGKDKDGNKSLKQVWVEMDTHVRFTSEYERKKTVQKVEEKKKADGLSMPARVLTVTSNSTARRSVSATSKTCWVLTKVWMTKMRPTRKVDTRRRRRRRARRAPGQAARRALNCHQG
jgi:hypothetical protein